MVRMSIARLVRHPGQYTSSHGVPAVVAHRIVGDHSAPRPAASAAFQRLTTRMASSRAASSAARARWSVVKRFVLGHPVSIGRRHGGATNQTVRRDRSVSSRAKCQIPAAFGRNLANTFQPGFGIGSAISSSIGGWVNRPM
jgi:hypothetical protein